MKKILSFFLVILLLTALTPSLFAQETVNDEINILACSDFQDPDGISAGRTNISLMINAMQKAGLSAADAFFCCGDYDTGMTNTKSGIIAVKSATKKMLKENAQSVFVQGNHDSANSAAGTNGLAFSGNNDPTHQKYGVFVINEEDYMWYNDDKATIQNTAQNLTEYLNEKLADGYDKPIFILSHLPLHYSMRTSNEGCAKYANLLFSVINEAGEKGLNIFFLFGHDHSNGWDDYLGGSAIYLTHGDSMLVAQNSTTAKSYHKMSFTYFNAGYTGYYDEENGQKHSLTMTYITIKDNEVSISRYNKQGLYNMKNKGVTNAHKNEKGYEPNETVRTSPQTVTLSGVKDQAPIKELLTINKTQAAFKRLEEPDEIVSGKTYLIVNNASTDRVMLTNEIEKTNSSNITRAGFEAMTTTDFGALHAYSAIENALWTFEKSNDGWILKKGDLALTYKETSDKGTVSYLAEEGTVLTIEDSGWNFTFEAGDYALTYNAQGLIGLFKSSAADFYIYEAIGYGITATNADATVNQTSVRFAMPGDTVTLTANETPEGFVFEGWEVLTDGITLADPMSKTQTLTMPSGALNLKARYRSLAPETPSEPTDDPFPQDQNDGIGDAALIIAAISVLIMLASAITFYVAFKKTKVN